MRSGFPEGMLRFRIDWNITLLASVWMFKQCSLHPPFLTYLIVLLFVFSSYFIVCIPQDTRLQFILKCLGLQRRKSG